MLVLFSVFFFFRDKKSPLAEELPNIKIISVDRTNPKTLISKHSITETEHVTEPVLVNAELPKPYQDSFSVTLNAEQEAQWENEMYQHLTYLDEEHADKIFNDYRDFKNKRDKSLENDLTNGIKQLSDMNGQSGEVESIYSVTETNDKDELKHILGPHYEFLEGARRDFLTNNN